MGTELGPQAELAQDFSATAQEISTLYPNPPMEFLFSGNAGTIHDFRSSEQRKKIGVPTNCGVVANKNQEIMTTNVVGCAALYLKGTNSNIFVHLTPNSEKGLGYRYWREKNRDELAQASADKVMASVPEEEDKSSIQGIIVINVGSETGGDYDYRKIRADADRYARLLEEAGIANVKVVEVPLASTSVYATPEKPGKLFVCGADTEIEPDGRLHSKKIAKGFWVDIDPDQNVEYVKHGIIEKAA